MKTQAESTCKYNTMFAIKDLGKNLKTGHKEHQDLISSLPDVISPLNRRPFTPLLPNPNPNPNPPPPRSLHLKTHPLTPSQQPPLKRSHKAENIDGAGGGSVFVDNYNCVQQRSVFDTEEHRRSLEEVVRSVVVRFLAQGGMFSQIASPALFRIIENDERVTAVEKAAIKEAGGIKAVENALRSLAKDNSVLLHEAVMIERPLLLVLKTDRVRLRYEANPGGCGGVNGVPMGGVKLS